MPAAAPPLLAFSSFPRKSSSSIVVLLHTRNQLLQRNSLHETRFCASPVVVLASAMFGNGSGVLADFFSEEPGSQTFTKTFAHMLQKWLDNVNISGPALHTTKPGTPRPGFAGPQHGSINSRGYQYHDSLLSPPRPMVLKVRPWPTSSGKKGSNL